MSRLQAPEWTSNFGRPAPSTRRTSFHTGKRDFEEDDEAQKTIDRLDKIVKKHAQGVGAAFGDLTTSCSEIQSELDSLEPQWRAWVSTLQKKVQAEKDVDET